MYEESESCEMEKSPKVEIAETPLSKKLQARKQFLEAELALVNQALEALASNPEVAKMMDTISKISRRL